MAEALNIIQALWLACILGALIAYVCFTITKHLGVAESRLIPTVLTVLIGTSGILGIILAIIWVAASVFWHFLGEK